MHHMLNNRITPALGASAASAQAHNRKAHSKGRCYPVTTPGICCFPGVKNAKFIENAQHRHYEHLGLHVPHTHTPRRQANWQRQLERRRIGASMK